MMTFFLYTCITLFIIISLLLVLIILIQKGRGGGLSSAFGGGAGGHSAFGSKTGDVLTWVTSVIFGIFLLLAVLLNLISDRQNRKSLEAATKTDATQTEMPAKPETPATNPATMPVK